MKALCTGAAGFIGSHVTDLLINEGWEVVALDDLSQGRREWVNKEAQFFEGSVTNYQFVQWLSEGCDAVFHLAAMSRVLPSLNMGPKGCLFSADQNIMGTLNVLVAAVENKVKKLIYSASSTAYGDAPSPQAEIHRPNPSTSYAVSKYVGELYCKQFTNMYGLTTACLRYFQVYGPRQPVSGEYAMVNGIFLEQKKQGKSLTIHGDGSQRRDFVWVGDVAKANLLAYEKIEGHSVINIGTGKSVSIKELADMISDKQVFEPPRAHDMKETRAAMAFCERELGWRPGVSFEQGMRELLDAS